MKWKVTLLAVALSFNAIAATDSPAQIAANKKAFIQTLVSQNHFNRQQLTTLLNSLKPNQKILHAMTRPFEKKPWTYYRSYFVTPKRIQMGADYLRVHHAQLMQLQHRYGIPATIITAIIGVETEYGTHLGKFSVLNTLYTLGFYYPPREKFFRKELGQYLILARDNHLPLKTLKGSYAGALGIPQFMPSSYRYFGVSAENNGNVNLFRNPDAIASVANYFHKNGWHANQPIAHQLSQRPDHLPNNEKLLVLPGKNGNQYWAVDHNFYTIMTYNHNVVYAMAVYQLSQAIQKQYDERRSS